MPWRDETAARIEAAWALLARTREALPTVFACAHSVPVAMWVKAPDGRMLWVNRMYEARFGKPIETYTGKGDGAVWDATTAAGFGSNDKSVIDHRMSMLVDEDVPMPDGSVQSLRFWKWPVIDHETETVIGVGGMEVMR